MDYKIGGRIELTKEHNFARHVPVGTKGTIEQVDPDETSVRPIMVRIGNGVIWPHIGTFKLLEADKPPKATNLDPAAVSTVVTALRGFREKYVVAFDTAIMAHKAATTIEEVMEAKKGLLLAIVDNFPAYSQTCYFCEANRSICGSCGYVKFHGQCPDEDSDYGKIRSAKEVLKETLQNYYKGESYTTPAPPKELEVGDLVTITHGHHSYAIRGGKRELCWNREDSMKFKIVQMNISLPNDKNNDTMVQNVDNGEVVFIQKRLLITAEK
jgi:hypothetical protein